MPYPSGLDVSFIIPLYNCLPLTQAMLASLQPTIPPGLQHEIIFVDDGSSDGTRDWLKTISTPVIRVVLNERNLGYAGANNRGASLARGRHLVLLNNDIVLTPGWLEPMLQTSAMLAKPGLVGNVQRRINNGAIDHTGIFINARGVPQHDHTFPAKLTHRLVVAATGACLLIETALWRELGGFDEHYVNGCEDVDLCFKARQVGRINAVSLQSVIFHHVSASPGRKERDEHNTRRLTERWREQLVDAGLDAWCRQYFECDLNAALAFDDPGLAFVVAQYVLGIASRPPARAAAAFRATLDRESVRRSQALGLG